MKSLLFTVLLLSVSVVAADRQVDDAYSAYRDGNLTKARELLRQIPASSTRDANRLFITALLSESASSAQQLLATAVKSDLDGKYREEAYFRLIQLAEAKGDTVQVLALGGEYLKTWENSRFREQLLALMAAHVRKESAEEERYLNLLIEEAPGSYYGQCARLVKANYAFDKRHYNTAETHCRKINNAPGDDLVPNSLIMLSLIGLRQGQTERALLNYNILREKYWYCIGLNNLLAALKIISEEASDRESDEIFEGVTYSVQVGVFSIKNNARNMVDRVKAYGYKAKIKRKNISGAEYYIVLAGQFKTLSEADIAKQKLELGEKEIFRVVVND